MALMTNIARCLFSSSVLSRTEAPGPLGWTDDLELTTAKLLSDPDAPRSPTRAGRRRC